MEQSKFYQIKNVTEHEYTLVGCDGNVIRRPIKEVDKSASVFTIQDAKDGDMLAAKECYVIFKEIDGLNIKCHCTYHYMGFNPSFHINTLQNKTAFHPATKEERDLLFQKMEEEGYQWDAEKKELKLLISNGGDFESDDSEQNSTLSDEDKMMLNELINGFYGYRDQYPNFWKLRTDEIIDWLKSLKERLS